MDVHNIEDVPAFTTKDGSEIRELLAHRNSCIRQQSLAEARLGVGAATVPHHHPQTEEIYYISHGPRADANWQRAARGRTGSTRSRFPPGKFTRLQTRAKWNCDFSVVVPPATSTKTPCWPATRPPAGETHFPDGVGLRDFDPGRPLRRTANDNYGEG